jgi:hypothetical protein
MIQDKDIHTIKKAHGKWRDVRRYLDNFGKVARAYNSQEMDAIKTQVVEELSSQPVTLHYLCDKYTEWPSVSTLLRWEREDPEFESAMKLALKQQARILVDTAFEVSCDANEDYVDNEKGIEIGRSVAVSRAALASKTMLHIAGLRDRENYGPRPTIAIQSDAEKDTQENWVKEKNKLVEND